MAHPLLLFVQVLPWILHATPTPVSTTNITVIQPLMLCAGHVTSNSTFKGYRPRGVTSPAADLLKERRDTDQIRGHGIWPADSMAHPLLLFVQVLPWILHATPTPVSTTNITVIQPLMLCAGHVTSNSTFKGYRPRGVTSPAADLLKERRDTDQIRGHGIWPADSMAHPLLLFVQGGPFLRIARPYEARSSKTSNGPSRRLAQQPPGAPCRSLRGRRPLRADVIAA
ncbi:uncharacterized protein [Dermacentor albipictus]|uniref:uncharacterized protein n=1 Tax=Dermacentor albipictus TaxID=60249 RepID=UPI0038FC96E2